MQFRCKVGENAWEVQFDGAQWETKREKTTPTWGMTLNYIKSLHKMFQSLKINLQVVWSMSDEISQMICKVKGRLCVALCMHAYIKINWDCEQINASWYLTFIANLNLLCCLFIANFYPPSITFFFDWLNHREYHLIIKKMQL